MKRTLSGFRLISLLTTLALGLALAGPLSAQDAAGTVAGRVVNGSPGGAVLPNAEVLLHIFKESGQPEFRTATVDGDARFKFEGVPLQGVSSYTVFTTYLGVDYAVELAQGDVLSDVTITVYEPTSSLDNVSILQDSVMVVGVDSAARAISVFELILLSNKGQRVFVPNLEQGGPMTFLRFPLPSGYTNLQVQTQMPSGEVMQVERGFALTSAVPPGEHGIAVAYAVPYTSGSLDLSRTFLGGVQAFRLLLPQDLSAAPSPALLDMGTTTVGDAPFRLYQAQDVPAGGALLITLEGLPQLNLYERARDRLESPAWRWAVLAAAALLAATFIALAVRAAKRRPAPVAVGVDDSRGSLLEAIAALDDRYEQGEVQEAQYQEDRSALKARLLALSQQEESAP